PRRPAPLHPSLPISLLPERVKRARSVVLSDYGKGVLTDDVLRDVIRAARAAQVPVLVDPKSDDFGRYRGATLVTPNRKAAEQARTVEHTSELQSPEH